jgi:hypothetical protein
MRIIVQAGLPVHWQGKTIEYSLMSCIMDSLLILNRQDQWPGTSRGRETSGMISGILISE